MTPEKQSCDDLLIHLAGDNATLLLLLLLLLVSELPRLVGR